MNVEVLEHEERKLVLKVEDATTNMMNALRRTLMMEVPKLAIEEVTIYDNRSALFDEIIAHRLGLLPVPTDPKMFALWDPDVEADGDEEEEEDEDDDLGVQVLYTLTFEGPGTVYARDLTPATGAEDEEIVEPEMPIVKLGQDQRLMLEATAVLGTGATHAKWQPVVACGYREYPIVEVPDDLELDPKVQQEIERLAPEGVFGFENGSLQVLDPVQGYDFLYNAAERLGVEGIEFDADPDTFLFQFETDGALSAKEAFRQAIKVLMDKLQAVGDGAGDL